MRLMRALALCVVLATATAASPTTSSQLPCFVSPGIVRPGLSPAPAISRAPGASFHVFRPARLEGMPALFAEGVASGKEASDKKPPRRPRGGKSRGSRKTTGDKKEARGGLKGTWRLFNIEVKALDDPGKDSAAVSPALLKSVVEKLGMGKGRTRTKEEKDLDDLLADADEAELEEGASLRAAELAQELQVEVVRKSFDARIRRRGKLVGPCFNYVVDVTFPSYGSKVELRVGAAP
ncbi:hypothetical protein T484DRAFT_1777527 [Baffinella frigidus]|nr:hypothetical protein T484DRAFT_1777527 [Cryptophyta sp. CCMP2293]